MGMLNNFVPLKLHANKMIAGMYGYSNGGDYSTTSYGAQGGAEGGGFLGSQGGSQDSPSGPRVCMLFKTIRYEDTKILESRMIQIL